MKEGFRNYFVYVIQFLLLMQNHFISTGIAGDLIDPCNYFSIPNCDNSEETCAIFLMEKLVHLGFASPYKINYIL